eukprot:GHVN01044350.1.p1 GENE.GHVN01044350.1~~GHVN01044350.1.p1  ORF type:complete len:685 (+),score=52.22 GHVN01044350.1:123-2177(+)
MRRQSLDWPRRFWLFACSAFCLHYGTFVHSVFHKGFLHASLNHDEISGEPEMTKQPPPLAHLCSHLHPNSCSHEGGKASITAPSTGTTYHMEHKPAATLPLHGKYTFESNTKESLALLEQNHHTFFEKGLRHVAYRGEGPFGSLGATESRIQAAFVNLGTFVQDGANSNLLNDAFAFLESKTAARNVDPGLLLETQSKGGAVEKTVQIPKSEMALPIAQLRDSQYVGAIGVGTSPQFVHPIFDTGSTNVWVVSKSCETETCSKVTRFDSRASTSFYEGENPLRLDITFGTGKISGTIGRDVFQLGDIKVQNQSFGLVESEVANEGATSNIFELINFEGIVGLAFPELSSTGQVPFYDNLIQQNDIESTEIAFYLVNTQAVLADSHPNTSSLQQSVTVGSDGSAQTPSSQASTSVDFLKPAAVEGRPISAMFVGGVDPRFFHGPIQMLPVVREHYWEVKLDSMYIGDKKFCCDQESYIIFDSGTSFNTLPSGEIGKFFQMVPPRACDENDPNFLDAFPTLKYTMSGVQVTLTPEMYIVRSAENICKPAYMQIDVPSEFGHAFIFGSTSFMRHFYTVFRRGAKGQPSMIGIAPAKHTKEGVAYLTNLINESPGFGPSWVSKQTSTLEEEFSGIENSRSSQSNVEVSVDAAARSGLNTAKSQPIANMALQSPAVVELSAVLHHPAEV